MQPKEMKKFSHNLKSLPKIKSSSYSRYYTERVTSGGFHLHGLTPWQCSSEETSQPRRDIDHTLSDLTDPGIEPETSCANGDVYLTIMPTGGFQCAVNTKICIQKNVKIFTSPKLT